MKVGITYHEKFSQYDLGLGHPFRGDRFNKTLDLFKEKGLLNLPDVLLLSPEPAIKRHLIRVHHEEYINLIYHLAETKKRYDVDTPVSPEILEAALLIVGGAIEAGRAIFKGKVNRMVSLGCGFHHAGRNYGGGFCLINDIAVLIEYIREKFGVKRVLNLDYDVHFGNGTSDIYYSDPNVLFISLHQDPRTIYPNTGFIEQVGIGDGEGYNVNIPLPPGTGNETYMHALREIFVPLAEEFKPDIIIANGGSDAHFADMLGNLGLGVGGFFDLSRTLVEVSDKACQGRVVLMPGSGYNRKVLPSCWYALTAGIVGLKNIDVSDFNTPPFEPDFVREKVEKTISELKHILHKYWKCF